MNTEFGRVFFKETKTSHIRGVHIQLVYRKKLCMSRLEQIRGSILQSRAERSDCSNVFVPAMHTSAQ